MLFLLLAAPLFAQDQTASGEKTSPSAEQLVSSTLPDDIATASYYELVAWCRRLGIDDSGARKDLQSKLYSHYGVSAPAEKPKAGNTITVKSSKESEYFTVDEINQKYVVLRGNVEVSVEDQKNGSVQDIQAQSLTYNQTLNTVTATGGVRYSITRSGKTDVFTGDGVSVNIDTGEGVFYDGQTTRPLKRGGQDVTFQFQGDTFTRLSGDTVLLDNGGFTSADEPPNPYYQLRADKIWILAPGEWALENAVLWVGHIPVLYLPIFFYPGDQLFFNPSIGYDKREGTYLQTTTYLLGKKKPQNDTFSFLQLTSGEEGDYDLQLRGLFLRKIAPQGGAAPKNPPTLKLELDGYTRMGLFLGLVGDFPSLASFQVGIAESRSIFTDSTGQSTALYLKPDGTTVSYWNSTSLFGVPLPLRFGMNATMTASADLGSLAGHFEYYSDPQFPSDFYSRSEGLQFTSNLESLIAPAQQTPTQNNLSWDLTGRAEFARLLNATPYLASLSIPSLNVKLSWQSKKTAQDPSIPNDVYNADPGQNFYYPTSLVAPNVSFSASGELFRFSTTQAAAPPATAPPAAKGGKATADPGKGFRSPIPQSAAAPKPQAAAAKDRLGFRIPDRRPNLSVTTRTSESSASVTYQVQPRALLEQTFDSSQWTSPQNVDFRLLYGTFETGGSTQITATTSLLDRMLGTSVSLSQDGTFRTRYKPATSTVSADTWSGLTSGDVQADKLALRSIFQGSLLPLLWAPALSGSSITYRLNLRLFQYAALPGTDPMNPQFSSVGPSWDTSAVSEHSLTGTLSLKLGDKTDTMTLSAVLPPLNLTYNGRLDFWLWLFRSYLQGGATQTSGVWQFQPTILGEVFQPLDKVSVSEELQYDANTKSLMRSTSQLALWGLSASYTMENIIPTNPLGVAKGTTKEFVPSQLRIGYQYSATSQYFWKNRIRLDASVNTGWNLNLQRWATDNSFTFTTSFTLSIFKFLDMSFSSTSYNNYTYFYIPGWPQQDPIDQPWINPLQDLLDSFNFFSTAARQNSNFKLRSIAVKAVQHLKDWDLTFEYQGSPQLTTKNGVNQYEWTPAFAIQVQWVPVPEVKARTHSDTSGAFYLRE